MSDGREERKEQEERRRWAEQEKSPKHPKQTGDRPFREREWEERGREPS
jgi:hypothetical protein